jgi:UDP-3-O-[3-hydroxymyristoyl] N-acetylglucosamine deacetylase
MTVPEYPVGRLLVGNPDAVKAASQRFHAQPIDDIRLHEGPYPFPLMQTTLGQAASATGPGTFLGSAQRTLTFAPCAQEGWWIDRTDQQEQLPTAVSVRSVWTTARNIVLRSGSPHNYLRMVEHIIALRAGLGLDNLTIQTDSGDPPLFDRGNLDLVEAVERAGIVETDRPAKFVTVKEPVTFSGGRGDFLTFLPAKPGERGLRVDCAVDFASAIGKQRILFDVTPETFRYGSQARTNAPLSAYVYAKTVGKLFADTRHLGYTQQNILIHGKERYLNEAKLLHGDRSLEAVWHRATLDLLAAIALIDVGRFAGTLVSYRAGHTQDVRMATHLYLQDLLVPMD